MDATGIAAAVRAWAGDAPERPALIDGAATLTRGALLRWCEAAAPILRALALPAAPDDGPAICALVLPRSWAVPLGLIAARMAGLAFLLLDADAGAAIAARSGACLALTLHADAAAATIDPPHPALEAVHVTRTGGTRRLPPGAGHLVYTSGSSGEPKGVILRDAPLLATAAAQRRLLGLDGHAPAAPGLWALSPGFDASLSDIFCALLGPAPLAVCRTPQTQRRALAAEIARTGADRADLSPALLAALPPAALTLSAVVFGGERCDPAVAERWGAAVLALQAYGPTEAAVCATVARAGPGWQDGLLGRPLPHQIVLLAAEGTVWRVLPAHADATPDSAAAFNATTLAPFDGGGDPPAGAVEGEIWLAGDAVAMGYLDAPAEQAQRFGTIAGLPLFRTGDLARHADGLLLWTGRADRRIKRRGRWVSPEAIEAVAGAAWGSACLCVPGRRGMVLALAPGGTGDPQALPAVIAKRLGATCRPRAVFPLAPWPRLPNGKTDAAAVARAVADRLA